MSDNTKVSSDADSLEEEYVSGIVETPIAIRVARVMGGTLLGLVSVGLIVFLSITAQDRSAASFEENFLEQREAEANALPIELELQEKYGVADEDLTPVLGDLKRFDQTITVNLDASELTEITAEDNRIVFITESSRYFFEASSPMAFDYLNDYVEAELKPNIEAD
jgi:hypothetical protein